MKRLHRLIISSFLGPFVLTFFIVTFLLLMQFLWKYIDDLVGKGLEIGVIAELLLYTTASLVPMALPLAMLLASLMTMGTLGENYELTALKAAGISLQRIMFPLIVFSFFTSIGAFFFANNMLPYTNLKMRSLLYDVQQQRPELQIREGVFYNGIDGYSIRVGDRDYKTNLLSNIMIYDHTQGIGNVSVTIADSGRMMITADKSHLLLTLYSGYSYVEVQQDRRAREKTYPHRRDIFDKQVIAIQLSGFGLNRTDLDLFKGSFQMMNLSQLTEVRDSLQVMVSDMEREALRNLIKGNLYRYSTIQRPPGEDDEKLFIKHVPFDTLLSRFPPEDHSRMITMALDNSRSAKSQLSSSLSNKEDMSRRLRRFEIEWQRKFTLSVACFIFFFIGAPLGAIIRKGGLGMPVVISVLFFVVYYVISLTGEKFVREGILSPFAGMWLSAFILMPTGIFITYKAANDSMIMNMDTYTRFVKNIPVWINKQQVVFRYRTRHLFKKTGGN